MAAVQCTTCGLEYDDTYRFTYCPHKRFEMNTVVYDKDGQRRVCHTLEELDKIMAEQQDG